MSATDLPLVHDPHPSGAGVTEVDEIELILALDGGAA